MKAKGLDVVITRADLDKTIHEQACKRLNMTGEDFIKAFRAGKLPDTPAVRDIGMWVRLGEKPDGLRSTSKVHRLSKPAAKSNGHRQPVGTSARARR